MMLFLSSCLAAETISMTLEQNAQYNRQRRYHNYWIQRNEGMILPRDQLHLLVASIGPTRPRLLPSRS